jgi:hypothetical protein
MTKRISLTALAFAAVTAWGAHASAANIDIFNTGVDAGGAVVAHNTVGDLHYSLTSVPAGSVSEIRAITSAGGFPIGPWVGDNTESRWIGPNNNGNLDGPGGEYKYETTFDLTGLIPGTALLTGQWSADNGGVDILLNGVSTGNTHPGGTTAFTSFASFVIDSGFIAGVNTLEFIVNNLPGNGDNPTGLRVEFREATASAVPLPAALPLMAAGLGAFGFMGWRRKRA